jgi:hypothetical protein
MTTHTAEQRDLVDAIRGVLEADTAIEAAWLGRSLGRGAGDEFSDVDVMALVAEGPAFAVGQRYASEVGRIAEPVLVNTLYGGRVVNVVTDDWRRFDLSFIEAAELGRFDAARLVPLFNRGDRGPPRADPEAYRPTPETVLALVNEFLRVLGLLVGAVGREEWLLSLSGLDILRRLTIDLMLEENGVGQAERGGALRRNPLLTPEQLLQLASLSPAVADRAGVIAANAEVAAIFLPRARRLAAEIGATWPTAFEAATRRHLQERVGLAIG